jgi:hypothetical protein
MQKLNCKIGDLAIVVKADVPQNLGHIVEVVGLPTHRSPDLSRYGHVWRVRTAGRRPTLHYLYQKEGGRIRKAAQGPVPDCCLRPLTGLSEGDADSNQSCDDTSLERSSNHPASTSRAE